MTKEELEKEAREYLAEHSEYSEVFEETFVAVDTLTAMVDFAEPREKRIEELKETCNKWFEHLKNREEELLNELNNQNAKYNKQIEALEKENAELRNNGFTVSAMTEQQLKVALEKGEQLEKENAELKEALKNDKVCKCSHYLNFKDLEKENAELKKNYEDSLIACGVLKAKVDILAQPSPIEAMQDALITTQKVANEKQKEQLTKAKKLLKKVVTDFHNMDCVSVHIDKTIAEAEQFLKDSEVEK